MVIILPLYHLIITHKYMYNYRGKSKSKKVKFIGDVIETIKSKEYYTEVEIGTERFAVGSYVEVKDEERPDVNDIGRIEYMWKDSRGDGHLHVHWLT